eukprot:1449652-Prorocentrum_lima.AAC.1
MTRLLEESGIAMFGGAKYPIDKWTEAGNPQPPAEDKAVNYILQWGFPGGLVTTVGFPRW